MPKSHDKSNVISLSRPFSPIFLTTRLNTKTHIKIGIAIPIFDQILAELKRIVICLGDPAKGAKKK